MSRSVSISLSAWTLALGVFIGIGSAWGQGLRIDLKTATNHPMEYYVSLPQGWSKAQRWPVVVVIESANRDFQKTATLFAQARGNMPFVILTPLVVTNGGEGYRNVPTYHYTPDVWSLIDQRGPFEFDSTGIAAMMADARELYGTEDKYFLTGWEAGGHTLWALLFQHPERIRAAAPVSTNYLRRWMTGDAFSTAPERANLPVKIFQSEAMPPAVVGQIDMAKEAATAHGFNNVTIIKVAKPHSPMADDVLKYFASLLK